MADDAPLVLGLGGAGRFMAGAFSRRGMGVEVAIADLDHAALYASPIGRRFFLPGSNGLGSCANPFLASQAIAQEARCFEELCRERSLVLLCGLGGGTSGSSPTLVALVRPMVRYMWVVASLPYRMEGERRNAMAQVALDGLGPHVNGLFLLSGGNHSERSLFERYQVRNEIIADLVVSFLEKDFPDTPSCEAIFAWANASVDLEAGASWGWCRRGREG